VYAGIPIIISADFHFQTKFSSAADGLAAWGLNNTTINMKFIRREIRTLLLKYINEGDGVVERK
jgi:hypothetical protein